MLRDKFFPVVGSLFLSVFKHGDHQGNLPKLYRTEKEIKIVKENLLFIHANKFCYLLFVHA